MPYIHRDLEEKILSLSQEYSCLLLTGPRQVGKTTTLKHLAAPNRTFVTLDDLNERQLARTDPALFLEIHDGPILIDEVQYAPELFSAIKIAVDEGAAPGSFWLTGSQSFHMMELAQESLAGRAALLHLPALSQHEICGRGESEPFAVDLPSLKKREKNRTAAGLGEIYRRIWDGSLPGHISGKFTDREVFYSSYIQTYIERDVRDLLSRVDPPQFADFIRATACRVGSMLRIHDLAVDVGVSDDTAKRWLNILERSDILFTLRPYSNNLLKRTVRTPKIYFFDTGLVAYLTRYSTPEILQNGALNGAILENYVVAEIRKSYANAARDCLLWYYRDKNSREIDLILESDGELHPLEIKRSIHPGSERTRVFSVLDRGSVPRGKGAVLCLSPELSALDAENFLIPIWMI